MKKTCAALIILACTFSSCGSGLDSGADDELLTVRYTISSTTGARAGVLFLDENNEFAGTPELIEDGWEYTFKAEEGPRLLYLMTTTVLKGSVEAKIYVEDRLVASHVHEAPRSTLLLKLASSAWGRNDNIQLVYDVNGAFIDDINFEVPGGTETISAEDQGHFNYCRVDRELSVAARFEAGISISRDALDFVGCVYAGITYEPVSELERPLHLVIAQQCDNAPLNLSISVPVPGF